MKKVVTFLKNEVVLVAALVGAQVQALEKVFLLTILMVLKLFILKAKLSKRQKFNY